MKRMWTTIKETETHQLIDCAACTDISLNPLSIPVCIINDDEFYGNIGDKQVLLFEDKDDSPGSRLEILKELEDRECIRISELLIKRDTEFADGSLIERFGENHARVFSRNVHYNRLQTECNELMQEIVGVNRFPWKKKYEIPLVFTWPDIYAHSYYWDMIEDENMMPIYFFIILQGQNYMNWLKIIDTCSLFSDEVHLQIKTYLIYPKNDSAVDKCRRIVADIKKNHTLLDQLIQ